MFGVWQLPKVLNELRTNLEQVEGASRGARECIRVLLLLAKHLLERVRQAIEGTHGSGWRMGMIVARTEQLARQSLANVATEDEVSLAGSSLPAAHVPAPNLDCFDQVLSTEDA